MFRLFPERNYSARLAPNEPAAWERLRTNTELRDTLITVRTSKAFIGQVRPGTFKLISSEIGRGAICTMEGQFGQDGSGSVRLRMHMAFRVMMVILLLMPVAAIPLTFFTNGPRAAAWQIPMAVVGLIFVRFVFFGSLFKSRAKSGLAILAAVLGLTDVKEVV